ncbi:MAG: FecR domain-containing protein [Stigonema ocellatum SAG 48.90 = DSM 106950]|nr:FecR domain-containing protein [Stigonema ocellatum SAG 48.90 = DSM 106950]
MFIKFFPFVVIGLWGVVLLPLPNRASASTPLTAAQIQDLHNLVQLMPQNQPKRQARKRDAMIPGDGLSTGRSSLADLRFNDGSLARVGEQALFRFLPNTRNFKLSNGTVLLLIPPGRGQTRINTPNAAAAIRGSALFVRYDQQTDTTIVGALTNSGIQIFNRDASQSQKLQAGQLMVIVKGKFQGLYDFDLRTFYHTSDMVRGLDLTEPGVSNLEPAIAQVKAEIAAAVAAQSPITGQGVVENPSFLRLTPSSSNFPSVEIIRNNSLTNSLLETGQILSPANNIGTTKEPPTIDIRGTGTPPQPVTPPSTITTPPQSVTPPSTGTTPPQSVTPPSTGTTPPQSVTPPSTGTTRPVNPTPN